jgi:YHS domain-containing protein
MFIKLLIYLGLGYVAYKLFKTLVSPKTASQRKVRPQPAGQIDDIMIKDPFCETYFPKRDGIHLKFEGKDLYFCSTECRDKFLDGHSNANPHDD